MDRRGFNGGNDVQMSRSQHCRRQEHDIRLPGPSFAGYATSETLQPAFLPPSLSRLQSASASAERDDAWEEFIRGHSDVVLHACRFLTRDRDLAMDAYTFVLEALRADGCRRLRAYVPDGRTKFTTWLVVVSRRLGLDYLRQRYGRSRSDDVARREEQGARRRLEDLVADEIDPDQLSAASHSPDAALQHAELVGALRLALDQLDSADRLLLVLRFVDERSVREIARALGLPTVFHVYRRLGSALAALRASLARRGVDGPEP